MHGRKLCMKICYNIFKTNTEILRITQKPPRIQNILQFWNSEAIVWVYEQLVPGRKKQHKINYCNFGGKQGWTVRDMSHPWRSVHNH